MPDHPYTTNDSTDFQRLQTSGFSDHEAELLIHMKDHMADKSEYREMVAESRRLDFMRWLIEHDRMSR